MIRDNQPVILVIPRDDGLKVSVSGKVYDVPMTPSQMQAMAIRFQEAAMNMLIQERRGVASSLSDALHGSAPDDTNDSIPSH